jgi:ABC-type Fe3+/spermidine/putrescine transport system ATPase subunit
VGKELDGKRFAVSALGDTPLIATGHQGPGVLMMRPSQFRLAAPGEHGITGVVIERYFTGEHTEITVLLPDGASVHAHLPEAPASLVPGSTARLATRGVGVLLPTTSDGTASD